MLISTVLYQKTKVYHIKHRSRQERVILVEHPFSPEWKIVSEKKPLETSRDMHRFEVKIQTGELVKLEVVEEHTERTEWVLGSVGEQSLTEYIKSPATSEKVKEAFGKILQKRAVLANLSAERTALEERVKDILEDQTRLRANIQRMPSFDSDIYKRYLLKFEQQETELEKLQASMNDLRESLRTKQRDFEKELSGLTVK
jgi:hypothetical protein